MARSLLAKLAALALALGMVPDRVAPATQAAPSSVATRGEVSLWHGFRRHSFRVANRAAFVVAPDTPAAGAPWIWRATFWDLAPEVDLALLAAGFHVGFVETEDMYGSPAALAVWDEFYELATRDLGLSRRPVLEGISRGGLYAYRWAEAHPERVSAVLGDAPVCDFRSWPKAHGTAAEWLALEREYGFENDDEALRFPGNPVDGLAPLAREGALLVLVYGDADTVVPPAENALVLASRYRALGGRVELFPKPGVGHAHGLPDPSAVVALLRSAAR